MAIDLEKQTKDIYAAFNAHDLDKFVSFHTDDVSVESVAEGRAVHGKEGLRTYIDAYFAGFSDIKMEMTACVFGHNRQCEEYVISGTHNGSFMGLSPTGKSVSLRGIIVRELKEGKTSHVSNYYDSASFMHQLGVPFLPPTPQK